MAIWIFHRIKKYKYYWNLYETEGQDGPGSLTWVFEITLAIFCPFQRRIYKNFFMSVQCK